mgnify:CR=1 FL=1
MVIEKSYEEIKKEEESKRIQKKARDMLNPTASNYTPIKSLNTFLFDWRIKARITKKYPKKDWKNANKNGTLLNIELIDFSGG